MASSTMSDQNMDGCLTKPHPKKPQWLEKYSRLAIVGMGMTGCSVLEYLKQFDLELLLIDNCNESDLIAKVKPYASGSLAKLRYKVGELQVDFFESVDLIVVSPGISVKSPAIFQAMENGVEVCGDIDLLGRGNVNVPIIGITGSNGKSTVTTLVGEFLKASGKKPFIGGNIGLPALSLLTELPNFGVAVLELSSFQLDTTSNLNLMSSVNLNVSPDHMDRYDSYQDYVDSKSRIHKLSRHCVFNRDDDDTSFGFPDNCKKSSFGLSESKIEDEVSSYSIRDNAIYRNGVVLMPLSDVNMIGRHNMTNILAALAVIEPLDIDFDDCRKVLQTFTGLPHRTQLVAKYDGVTWVNDSKATNIGACKAAIDGVDGRVILIAGGQGKGGDFESLTDCLKVKVKQAYIFGEDSDEIYLAWNAATECEQVDDLDEAVLKASKTAQEGDTVLLSPACASFDMYPGFAARGEHFTELVEAL